MTEVPDWRRPHPPTTRTRPSARAVDACMMRGLTQSLERGRSFTPGGGMIGPLSVQPARRHVAAIPTKRTRPDSILDTIEDGAVNRLQAPALRRHITESTE